MTKYLKVSQSISTYHNIHKFTAAKHPNLPLLEAAAATEASAATEADVVDTHTPTHSTAAEAVEVVDSLPLRTEAPHLNPPIELAERRRKISTYTKA